jgi:hypothetical protein
MFNTEELPNFSAAIVYDFSFLSAMFKDSSFSIYLPKACDFKYTLLNRYKVVSHCGFDLHFSI